MDWARYHISLTATMCLYTHQLVHDLLFERGLFKELAAPPVIHFIFGIDGKVHTSTFHFCLFPEFFFALKHVFIEHFEWHLLFY